MFGRIRDGADRVAFNRRGGDIFGFHLRGGVVQVRLALQGGVALPVLFLQFDGQALGLLGEGLLERRVADLTGQELLDFAVGFLAFQDEGDSCPLL